MAATETSLVKALNFEIVRRDDRSSSTQPVSGYLSIAETDGNSSEILQKLSNAGVVEKFTLFYQNYTFSLLGASFKIAEDAPPRDENLGITYAFYAKDILLSRDGL